MTEIESIELIESIQFEELKKLLSEKSSKDDQVSDKIL